MSNILMTPAEVRELERMCSDPLLELGMTLRPRHLECFKPKIATSTIMNIIKFEEHEHAEKWNKMHEDSIRKSGHIATITLAVLGGTITRNYIVGVVIASSSGIVKDEMQAHVWFPRMFKGWLLTRRYKFSYEQFPGKHFYMEWTDLIQDETGKEQERYSHGRSKIKVGGPSGIPEKLVRDLISKTPKFHTSSFK